MAREKLNQMISFCVSERVYDAAQRVADVHGTTISEVVRYSLQHQLAQLGALQPRPLVNGHSPEAVA